MRVQIIDQSSFARAALPPLVEADPQLEVVGVSVDWEAGLREAVRLDPEVVLLAPGPQPQDAVTFLRRLMASSPRPVLALIPPHLGPQEHLAVLEAGAVMGIHWDLDNTTIGVMAFQSLLTARLKALAAARLRQEDLEAPQDETDRTATPMSATPPPVGTRSSEDSDVMVLDASLTEDIRTARPRSPLAITNASGGLQRRKPGQIEPHRHAEVMIIGANSGGVAALRQLITQVPPDLNMALLGVMNLPEELLQPLAERLNRESNIRVMLAREGDPVRPRVLLLAPAGVNLGLVRTGRVPRALVRLTEPEHGLFSVPSIDVTMRACAAIYGAATAGLILSGLSRDGLAGLQALKARGGTTAVLDPSSAVVSTTNQLCIEAGVVDELLPTAGVLGFFSRLGLNT